MNMSYSLNCQAININKIIIGFVIINIFYCTNYLILWHENAQPPTSCGMLLDIFPLQGKWRNHRYVFAFWVYIVEWKNI